MKRDITFTLNGEQTTVTVDTSRMLLEVLRDDLGLTGAKECCSEGDCGACTVLVDGAPINSCLYMVGKAEGRNVLTIEGLGQAPSLHPIQTAFLEHGAVQCGFCTPGMVLSAKALLDRNPQPTDAEIREAIAGNLCRCTGYVKIVEAIKAAAGMGGGTR